MTNNTQYTEVMNTQHYPPFFKKKIVFETKNNFQRKIFHNPNFMPTLMFVEFQINLNCQIFQLKSKLLNVLENT